LILLHCSGNLCPETMKDFVLNNFLSNPKISYHSGASFLTLMAFGFFLKTISIQAAPPLLDRELVNRGFLEIAPIVTKVIVKKGDPFIEVFLQGEIAEGDCFDKKEYLVETKKDYTQVLARFRKNNPDAECKAKASTFTDKVADLDPANPASQIVKVLGFYGWSMGQLEGAPENK